MSGLSEIIKQEEKRRDVFRHYAHAALIGMLINPQSPRAEKATVAKALSIARECVKQEEEIFKLHANDEGDRA